MTINQHNAVTFNDGEPLDPVKLNKLAKNVDNLYQMSSIANQTSNGNLAVPIVFTLFKKFEDVGKGETKEFKFGFGDTFEYDEIKGGKVFVAATLRSPLQKGDNVTVSVFGVTDEPTLYVINNSARVRNISVDIIAIVMREVSAAG